MSSTELEKRTEVSSVLSRIQEIGPNIESTDNLLGPKILLAIKGPYLISVDEYREELSELQLVSSISDYEDWTDIARRRITSRKMRRSLAELEDTEEEVPTEIEVYSPGMKSIVVWGLPASSKSSLVSNIFEKANTFGRPCTVDMFDLYLAAAEEHWGARESWRESEFLRLKNWNKLSDILYLGTKLSRLTNQEDGSVKYFDLMNNAIGVLEKDLGPSQQWVISSWDLLAATLADEINRNRHEISPEHNSLHLVELPGVAGPLGNNRGVTTLRRLAKKNEGQGKTTY
jgi:hypothetical protein